MPTPGLEFEVFKRRNFREAGRRRVRIAQQIKEDRRRAVRDLRKILAADDDVPVDAQRRRIAGVEKTAVQFTPALRQHVTRIADNRRRTCRINAVRRGIRMERYSAGGEFVSDRLLPEAGDRIVPAVFEVNLLRSPLEAALDQTAGSRPVVGGHDRTGGLLPVTVDQHVRNRQGIEQPVQFRGLFQLPRRDDECPVRNLLAVWLLTGLWHGGTWNFLLWGLILGLLVTGEKFGYGQFLGRHKILSHVYLLTAVPLTWVVFAIPDLGQLGLYFTRLFPFFGTGSAVVDPGDFARYLSMYGTLLAAGCLCCLPVLGGIYRRVRQRPLFLLLLLVLFWTCVYQIANASSNPFLYFQF